jgi:hypothetical protein
MIVQRKRNRVDKPTSPIPPRTRAMWPAKTRTIGRLRRHSWLLLQLEALADPNHPDHENTKKWFGDFHPIRIDDQSVKNRLGRIPNRCTPLNQKQTAWRRLGCF